MVLINTEILTSLIRVVLISGGASGATSDPVIKKKIPMYANMIRDKIKYKTEIIITLVEISIINRFLKYIDESQIKTQNTIMNMSKDFDISNIIRKNIIDSGNTPPIKK